MGGFFYYAKQQNNYSVAGIQRSLEALEKKRLSDGRLLSNKEVVERDDFVIYLYEKIGVQTENIFHAGNGDFVISTGTVIYKNSNGLAALENLYKDFIPDTFSFEHLQGQFSILLYKNDKLYIWNDLFGVYHLFTNEDFSVISSSFLAVVRQQKTKQVNLQAMYEYAFEGATYDDDTYISGVKLLDAFYVHQPGSDSRVFDKKHSIVANETQDFDERVELTVDRLIGYFETLKKCFGETACSALSGGYDSRLILALLSRVGIDPFLYVYGSEQSADVRVATAIAAAENLVIHHDNRRRGELSLEQFEELVEYEYFYCDGHGPNGVFSNGVEFNARTVRTNAAALQLNGGGGEIFRNFWKLPNRTISIEDFLISRFDRFPLATFNETFDIENYLQKLHEKIQRMLRIEHDVLTRDEVEKLYVYMRVKYWMGYNSSIQNVRSYALIPLVEPVFACSSFDIPFKHKDAGIFEAALIRSVSQKLAAYDSAYGYDFAGRLPLKARVKNFLATNLPVKVERSLRKYRYRYSRFHLPYFLQKDYVETVVQVDNSFASEYFNIENIRDPLVLSRLYTINLVLADPF